MLTPMINKQFKSITTDILVSILRKYTERYIQIIVFLIK